MLAGFGALQNGVMVEVVGQGNVDDIDRGILQHRG